MPPDVPPYEEWLNVGDKIAMNCVGPIDINRAILGHSTRYMM
jgi:hypothetical protein